jgi:hypothetical protein
MGIGDRKTPSLMQECDEIIAIIVSSIKTAKQVR